MPQRGKKNSGGRVEIRSGGHAGRGAYRPLKTSNAAPITATDAPSENAEVLKERRVLALLSEELAGRISTCNAGAVSLRITLEWCPHDGIPVKPILGQLAPGARFYSFDQTDDAELATRRVSCEIRALCAERLTRALDDALRSVAAYAALTEAMLKTHVVRLADPSVASATLVEELSRQLWGAGFPVSFGPSWTPAPGADLSVGVRGLNESFETLLRALPAWDPDEFR